MQRPDLTTQVFLRFVGAFVDIDAGPDSTA